ncbi:MAG: sel1 repeat family protein [Bacteroidales bacterium]|nr:sel1 repeat family protein [Candidatus Cacconaster equi]
MIIEILKALRFRRDYNRLSKWIVKTVEGAESYEEIEEPMRMLSGLGAHGLMDCKVFAGLVWMREDKPWYNPDKALEILEPLAEDGNPAAQFNVALLLYEGITRRGMDAITGLYWMQKAAAGGELHAKEFLRQREEGWELPNSRLS